MRRLAGHSLTRLASLRHTASNTLSLLLTLWLGTAGAAHCHAADKTAATEAVASQPAKDVTRVTPAGKTLDDPRLKPLRQLRDAYHPWKPPTTKDAWEKEATAIRERILVSNGLWPLPEKTPLKPVIHGKIDRGDYTVEKVFFASRPGHYVTGNLYRPTRIQGKVPGVLCPHGHWANGRFYDAGAATARKDFDSTAEDTMSGAHYPLQARFVHLARMGCIVFHYDMVGNADSTALPHRGAMVDAKSSLWLTNPLGLQTWNSIRALDFLAALPDVDPARIGVTGASGGGTQTFLLCALDPRPAVAFPAVMVSTDMQGGCTCENSDYLRIGINNIAFAAAFAPRPQAMSGANDWTLNIESKGLPELKQIYGMYGQSDRVHAKCFPQFGHNYNQVSRQMMYGWFKTHLKLAQDAPVVEREFWPVAPADLSVFDAKHPMPKDFAEVDTLQPMLIDEARTTFDKLLPKNADQAKKYRQVIHTAARVMLDAEYVPATELKASFTKHPTKNGPTLQTGMLRRTATGEAVPTAIWTPAKPNGTTVLWLDPRGKSHLVTPEGQPSKSVAQLLKAGFTVASGDVFLTGEFLEDAPLPKTQKTVDGFSGFTYGYNRPLLSNRTRDVALLISHLRQLPTTKKLIAIGTGDAGLWTLLGIATAGHVDEAHVDLNGFSFEKITQTNDPAFLPGAFRYGGVGGLAALAAPARLNIHGANKENQKELQPLSKVYTALGASESLQQSASPLDVEKVLRQLQR